jgi:hypothetical protein
MEPTDPLNIRVEQAFGAWRDKRQLLQHASQRLERALDAFAHGEGPEPVQLKAELEALRAECDQLFLAILEAVRAAQAAGVR